MTVKSVEMVHKIRNKHYEETKELKAEEQIKFIKNKSKELHRRHKKRQFSIAGNNVIPTDAFIELAHNPDKARENLERCGITRP